jgi:NADPH-dependent F420 reductase
MCKGGEVRVGILGGTGPLGRGLALRLADAGMSVRLGSRDPARCDAIAVELVGPWPDRKLAVEGVGNAAAAESEIVVAATPWDSIVPTVRELSGQLRGKVVVCVANALVKQGREMLALVPPRGSIAAAVQAALPESNVAAACHHLPASTLNDLSAALSADVLVCSDHQEATDATMAMLGAVAGLRPLDAGSLAAASAIEAFTAVLVSLNIRYKAHSTLQISGLDETTPGSRGPRTGTEAGPRAAGAETASRAGTDG